MWNEVSPELLQILSWISSTVIITASDTNTTRLKDVVLKKFPSTFRMNQCNTWYSAAMSRTADAQWLNNSEGPD
jgi:hypothetical protein